MLSDVTAPARTCVVVSGRTGSGKSTVTDHLVDAGCTRVQSSQILLGLAGPARSRRDRLTSWLDNTNRSGARDVKVDRQVDLRTWETVSQQTGPTVVESVALPFLVAPVNPLLVIRLEASETVRAQRLCGLMDVSRAAARLAVRRKDACTAASLRAAWGVDVRAQGAARWRADVVLRCPDPKVCADPVECRRATQRLAAAVFDVYRHYLPGSPTAPAAAGVRQLAALIRSDPSRVTRITGLLLDADGPFTAARWEQRLFTTAEEPC